MSKQNSAECQFAINMFKETEMSMKKLIGLLEKTVEQKRSCRSFFFDDQQDQRPGSGAQETLRGSDETAATSKYCIISID